MDSSDRAYRRELLLMVRKHTLVARTRRRRQRRTRARGRTAV